MVYGRRQSGIVSGRTMGPTILLIILVAVFLAVLPAWPYSRAWGPFPSGLVGLIVVLLIVLMFFNMI
jgi:Protein of unknown function (DUF3309)